jgi:hypothetical protein
MFSGRVPAKMRVKLPLRRIAIVLAQFAVFGVPLPALAQSCSLCYTQAASAGTRMIQALQSGILILIVPPTVMSVCMIFIVYRKRNQFRKADVPASNRNWPRCE